MSFPEQLYRHIPESSHGLIRNLWKRYPFELKITGHRNTRMGDYRFIPEGNHHLITVNKSLNQYQFLFTLIHEMAHQWVKIKYKRRQAPHGKAWKVMFKNLVQPFLEMKIFPPELEMEIKRHMQNPKASSSSDANLYKAFHTDAQDVIYLQDLEEGQKFSIGKRWFIKGPKRRTRFLCYLLPEKRKYTVSSIATVQLESPDSSGDI